LPFALCDLTLRSCQILARFVEVRFQRDSALEVAKRFADAPHRGKRHAEIVLGFGGIR
jgi:hypothetical protein